MLSLVQDIKDDFNNNVASGYNIDISNWDYVVVQLLLSAGTVTFSASNDSGAVTGGTDGSPASAQNFVVVQGTNLTSGSAVTTTTGTNSLVRFGVVGRYLQLSGATAVATKAFLYFTKIS